jgi:hypothetical protein
VRRAPNRNGKCRSSVRASEPSKKLAGKSAEGEPAGATEGIGHTAEEAILLALRELSEPVEPRPRLRLRAAMRRVGLDEWKIAWLLNFKIHFLAQSTKPSDSKLLLDYLKEAARHLDPSTSRLPPDNPMIELIHDVPRPSSKEEETV